MTDRQRNGFILLLVLGLLVVSGVIMTQDKTRLGLDLKGGVELTYQAEPTVQTPKVTPDALSHAVDIMRSRVDQIGVAEPDIRTYGSDTIVAALPDVTDIGRAEHIVGTTAQLAFYDWEANVIMPGTTPLSTVADGLKTQDQAAIATSQGSGAPGSGSQSLYDAVKLAAQ